LRRIGCRLSRRLYDRFCDRLRRSLRRESFGLKRLRALWPRFQRGDARFRISKARLSPSRPVACAQRNHEGARAQDKGAHNEKAQQN
jgi:hypothetical protein